MARTFSGKTGDTFVRAALVATIPDTTSEHDIDIPPGFYQVAAFVKSDATGTTTSIALHGFVDQTQTVIAEAPYSVLEINDTAAMPAGLAVVTGGAAEHEQIFVWAGTASVGVPRGVPILNGCRLIVEDGTGIEGELLEVSLIFQRV